MTDALGKRIMIIGSGGSGKSTFARNLGEKTGLPVIHLDKEYWKPNWQETAKDEWHRKVEEFVERDSWIIDGNYGGTMDIRLNKADTVIFLDLPTVTCIYSIIKRRIIYLNKTRPDMCDGCKEKMDLEFFLWVWNYKKRSRPKIIERLDSFKNENKNIIIFKTRKQVNRFINKLNKQ